MRDYIPFSSGSQYHQTAIALGSNLGDSRRILENALQTLNSFPKITVNRRSSWYQTAPIGPSQPDYLNGCALLEVHLKPQELLHILLEIEDRFGRIRQELWGPRTLDLDLILFENLILDTPDIQIPHPRMRGRAFVLVPLAEIAPNWIDPVSGETIAELVNKVDPSGVSKVLST